jgi:hypothetical protein
MRDNAREISRIVDNNAKMLEEATYVPNLAKAAIQSKIELNKQTI